MTAYLAETAALILAAFFIGWAFGFASRRMLTRIEQPAPVPAWRRAAAARTEIAVTASVQTHTTPTQILAARLEIEALAKDQAPVPEAAPASADMAAVAGPVASVDPVAEPPEDTATVASLWHAKPAYGKPTGLAAPREGHKEDLREIRGIDRRTERALNDLGIFHFDQIAAWDKKAVVWVEARLSIKGRIGRERWIAQATELTRGETSPVRALRA